MDARLSYGPPRGRSIARKVSFSGVWPHFFSAQFPVYSPHQGETAPGPSRGYRGIIRQVAFARAVILVWCGAVVAQDNVVRVQIEAQHSQSEATERASTPLIFRL